MLKSLYPRIDWSAVRAVGFDMDGTLYDEAEFIEQVYRPIAEVLCAGGPEDCERMRSWLFRRWLEKGSSYNRIFEEAAARQGIEGPAAQALIERCLAIFRGFAPSLTLAPRVRTLLDEMHERFALFLVSDGSAGLQMRKFESLQLQRWFERSNVGISGSHGAGYCKPATRILEKIAALHGLDVPAEVVFFGDRAADEQFAASAGFQFVRVKCMHAITS